MGSKKQSSTSKNHYNAEMETIARSYGPNSRNLRLLADLLELKINQIGHEVTITGGKPAQAAAAGKVLETLKQLSSAGRVPSEWDVECLVNLALQHPEADFMEFIKPAPETQAGWSKVFVKNFAQKRYLEAMATHDLVFGLGPAGTGKTYLAVAQAVAALNSGDVSKLIITRPAVEAGERLGFLPGDLAEKVNPYLRPVYDALDDLLPFEKYVKLTERRVIEIAPLAFMRGRTLNDAFVILDEAQNCTREQMKMFLTRLGPKSKTVVTGDVSQSDLPYGTPSGLNEAIGLLDGIEGIAFCKFNAGDVVRHRLVKKIIEAYDQAASSGPKRNAVV